MQQPNRNHQPRIAQPIALTGPAAAALYQLDGFKETIWPLHYTSPYSSRGGPNIIRTRDWESPQMIGEELVAALPIVMRHLNSWPQDLVTPDGLRAQDRVELAYEHARRLGHNLYIPRAARGPGDDLLRRIRTLVGNEPPTESYAETATLQWARSVGHAPWRQVEVSIGGKTYRIDFAFPLLGQRSRPNRVRPGEVLFLELNSREFHQHTFEYDTQKRNALDRAGFDHLELTPTEVTRHPTRALATLEAALRKATRSRQSNKSLTPAAKTSQGRLQKAVA